MLNTAFMFIGVVNTAEVHAKDIYLTAIYKSCTCNAVVFNYILKHYCYILLFIIAKFKKKTDELTYTK